MSRTPMILAGTLVTAAVTLACSGDPFTYPSAPSGHVSPEAASAGADSTQATSSTRSGPEQADVCDQGQFSIVTGCGNVYAPAGASLVRQPGGLQARLTMPTPQVYNLPAGLEPGHPEIYTLWIFVFDDPNRCATPGQCGPIDVIGPNPVGGAYNGGGHPASGASLTLAGRVAVGEAPVGGVPFQSPGTAEVHLAIAPHGGVDPEGLPDELRRPRGNPAFWWVALFP